MVQDFHWGILNHDQQAVLPALAFLKEYGMYLAGGTALALYLGHRQSIDFDFFTEQEFDSPAILAKFQEAYPNLQVIQQAKNTLYIVLNGVTTSMFTYRYPLVGPLIEAGPIMLLALEDIGAMKIQAIIQRGTKRDFVDMHAILQGRQLADLLAASEEKYGSAHNTYVALQALSYFNDADQETVAGRNTVLQKFRWPQIKKDILSAVIEYKSKYL